MAAPVSPIIYTDIEAQRVLVQQKIQEYFPEDGLSQTMITIANCESTGLIHWQEDGTLLPHSTGASSSAGVFQVLLKYHADQIQAMGLDMQDIDDYMTFVRQLYNEARLHPWDASASCWGTRIAQN